MKSTRRGSDKVFNQDYRKNLRLKDDTAIFLKTVQPTDKGGLVAGFARLSAESRYHRFFSYKGTLTGSDLKYFTEMDGLTHFALAAGHRLPDGSEEGIGIARFVILANQAGAAEPAVTVVDEWQGRGVGRVLFDHLLDAGRERGVERFECTVMADNKPMIKLLMSYSGARSRWDDEAIHITVDLAPRVPGSSQIPTA